MEEIDIAVTDNGTAAISWNTTRVSDGAFIGLYVPSNNLASVNEVFPGYVVEKTVHLISKFNVLYAVTDVRDGFIYAIRYKELVGGASGGWVSEHGTGNNNQFRDAAVSPSGNLYVVFLRGADIMYADNYGTTGDMTNRFAMISSAYGYTDPRIDVNGSPEVVYVTYTHEFTPGPGVSDLLVIVHCLANSCTYGSIGVVLPLNAALEWNVEYPPDIIADIGNTAYFTFRASNSDTGSNYKIFEGYFQDPSIFVGNISDTIEIGRYPSICLMWSIIPVTGWITGNDIYQFDTSPFILPYVSLRKIYDGSQTILYEDETFDMSCNADWGAGVWIEDNAQQQGYVIFITYPTMMPIIMK